MPDASAEIPADLEDYEAVLAGATPVDAWPRLDETDAAAMCYTSGTTGHPKGVVYTHRALFLHIMAMTMADTFALSESDVILHVVPMFHANAWCVPHAGVMVGAPRSSLDPIRSRATSAAGQAEQVTFTGAVPTVWIAVGAGRERGYISRRSAASPAAARRCPEASWSTTSRSSTSRSSRPGA
jgi:fatty-acyl-CoA synthase